MHRAIPDGADVRQAHITQSVHGWHISFSCLIPDPAPLPETGVTLGIDVGCIHENDRQRVAITSAGTIYTVPARLTQSLKRLATLQRLVSPRRVRGNAKCADPQSKRTAKRRDRIAKLHARIARQREHSLQYIARRIVDTADVIAVEQLDLIKMAKRSNREKRHARNLAMRAAAPGQALALIREKADAGGRVVIPVDPRNTSQICSDCGEQNKITLKMRIWTCRNCGVIHDCDINAARNIRDRATNSGAFSAGVPGEVRAADGSERGSMNPEAASAAGGENAATVPPADTVRNSRPQTRNNRVSRKTPPADGDPWHQDAIAW